MVFSHELDLRFFWQGCVWRGKPVPVVPVRVLEVDYYLPALGL